MGRNLLLWSIAQFHTTTSLRSPFHSTIGGAKEAFKNVFYTRLTNHHAQPLPPPPMLYARLLRISWRPNRISVKGRQVLRRRQVAIANKPTGGKCDEECEEGGKHPMGEADAESSSSPIGGHLFSPCCSWMKITGVAAHALVPSHGVSNVLFAIGHQLAHSVGGPLRHLIFFFPGVD